MSEIIKIDTLIIGGGISGLAAARRLKEEGKNFILVTDRIGGRMYHSSDGTMNFGATYINDDYKNVSQFVEKGQKLKLSEIFATNGKRLVPFLHPANVRYLFPFLKLLWILRRLRFELNQFRKEAEHVSQIKLFSKYPLMKKLAETPATEFINEYGLQELNMNYFRYVFWATCFAQVEEASALFYVGVLFPIIINTYVANFTNTYDKITKGIKSKIIEDRVITVNRLSNSECISNTSEGKKIISRYIIIAAPYHNAKEFYQTTPKPHLAKPVTVLYVSGRRKADFQDKNFILLNSKTGSIGLIWEQEHGSDLIFSIDPNPDISLYYSKFKLVAKVTWKTAVVISNEKWCPSNLANNVFLAGDYNICGLEDSYISGVCAANQIIKQGEI